MCPLWSNSGWFLFPINLPLLLTLHLSVPLWWTWRSDHVRCLEMTPSSMAPSLVGSFPDLLLYLAQRLTTRASPFTFRTEGKWQLCRLSNKSLRNRISFMDTVGKHTCLVVFPAWKSNKYDPNSTTSCELRWSQASEPQLSPQNGQLCLRSVADWTAGARQDGPVVAYPSGSRTRVVRAKCHRDLLPRPEDGGW